MGTYGINTLSARLVIKTNYAGDSSMFNEYSFARLNVPDNAHNAIYEKYLT